ncbi:MAG: hypothetical protein ACLT2D_02825 [Oscillospiraceae bacterium]
MQYLGVEYSVKHMPELDPDFIPFGVWLEAYARGAEKPLTIALERDQARSLSVRRRSTARRKWPRPIIAMSSAM